MRQKRMLGLLCIGALLFLGVYGARLVEYIQERKQQLQYDEYAFGKPCVQAQEVLAEKERLTAEENKYIAFEGVLIPYDKTTNTLFIPQNYEDDEWKGQIECLSQEYDIYIKKDPAWQDKSQSIKENHEFTLWLIGESQYYEFSLVVTGMPIINICTEYSVEAEEVTYEENPDKLYFDSETQNYGKISVFDPGKDGRTYQVIQLKVRYHLKGASTKGFDKKSYSLSLLNQKDENMDVSLLGMRSDNLWKLNSLVTDNSKVREITASQIWDKIDAANVEINETGPKMEYVELILDNEYRGLYCLVEPVDKKKTGVDNNDVIYKIVDYNIPTDEGIQDSEKQGWTIAYPIRIRYPESNIDYQVAWFPIRDYLNVFFRGITHSPEELTSKVCLDNLIDISLFTMVTAASDNVYKNTFYVAEVSDTGNYVMKQIPWDLDYTFGNEYLYGAYNNVTFNNQYDKIYITNELLVIYNSIPDEIGSMIREKWSAYRKDFLTFENITSLFIANRDYIVQSGAVVRDEAKWKSNNDIDLEELTNYMENRLVWLDEYFGQW